MASGVEVDKEVLTFFDKMKKSESSDERVRLATFKIENGFIKVDKVCKQKDLDEKQLDGFEYFKTQLTSEKCCYLLYDCHFSTKESGTKQELVFVMWCPGNALTKEKMNYASSKQALCLKHNLQINEFSDCSDRNKFAEDLGKTVTHIEGQLIGIIAITCGCPRSFFTKMAVVTKRSNTPL